MNTKLEREIGRAVQLAEGITRLRLSAVAEVLAGGDAAHVGFDNGVPPGTVLRWASIARASGVDALVALPLPEASLDGRQPDLPALAAANASPGIERTSLSAVASACRGASIGELARHHAADPTEVGEWIQTFRSLGTFGMRFHYRHPNWSRHDPEQAFVGRRRLPYAMSASFLRQLHMRSSGERATRLLFMALVYEGRSVAQAAEAVGARSFTAEIWLKGFINHGLAGLALRPAPTLTPRRKGFSAASIAEIGSGIANAEMRTKLSVIEMAYRSVPLADISTRTGFSISRARATIRAFEKDGLEGLSTGDATLTPPLRDDYSSAKLREIEQGMGNDGPGRRRMRALAELYDGISMSEAARGMGGLTALGLLLDRFNRFGHGVAESFKPWMRPTAPPPRKLPPPRPQPDIPAMRRDLNLMRLGRVRDAYNPAGRERIDIIMEAYAGSTIEEIAIRLFRSASTVRSYIDSFNAEGLGWLEEFKKKPRKARKVGQQISPEVSVPRIAIRRDICADVVRDAVFRSVDKVHRAELSVVRALYENNGLIGDLPKRTGVSEAEIDRLAAAFDLYGETFGHASNRRKMLPSTWDAQALLGAQMRPEPLRSYAHVVVWLYAGVEPDVIRQKFEMPQAELEAVVLAFREGGVAGLEADPLGIAPTMRRHRDIAPSPPVRPPLAKTGTPVPRPPAPVIHPVGRLPKAVTKQYVPPPTIAARPPMAVTSPGIDPKAVQALYEGRNARRLEAARGFRKSKDIREVSARFGVSAVTLEKWVIDYVKCGMAEIDRLAAKQA